MLDAIIWITYSSRLGSKNDKNNISFSFKNNEVDFYGLWKNENGKNFFFINPNLFLGLYFKTK